MFKIWKHFDWTNEEYLDYIKNEEETIQKKSC